MVNICSLSREREASTDHILIHYERTIGLWMFLLAIFGLK